MKILLLHFFYSFCELFKDPDRLCFCGLEVHKGSCSEEKHRLFNVNFEYRDPLE